MRYYVENELQCFVGNIFLGCFPTPTTNSLILWTPTRWPTVLSNSDTNYPELLSDSTDLRESHKTALTQMPAASVTHTSIQRGYKIGEFA